MTEPSSSACDEGQLAYTVLIVEGNELTISEYETLLTAIKAATLPLGLASRLRLHVAINDAADQVMDAFDGCQAGAKASS